MPSDQTIELGISPCPNDTFIFHGIGSGRLAIENQPLKVVFHDVESLNQMALRGRLAVTKLSAYAWLKVQDRYRLLNCGAALGYGCGPILIARRDLTSAQLEKSRVVLPGDLTTANLLFRMWAPGVQNCYHVAYDRIFDEIDSGRADAGVIIHENRFTFQARGFSKIVDLGQWWERETRLPIPLGCIAALKDLGDELIGRIESLIRQSIRNAHANPRAALPYIRQYAQEMDTEVIWLHIRTFVNDFSTDLGTRGRSALMELDERARRAGILA